MPMRICGRCGRLTAGETVHSACRKPDAYRDPFHRAVGQSYRHNGATCQTCGTRHTRANPIEAAHIVPVSEGGTNTIENYRPLCRMCNASDGTRQGTE
jgi:predicted restriction endonuclease